MEEEVVLLEEQLTAAHTDIERLQALLGEAEGRNASQESATADLRRELEAARAAIADWEAAGATQTAELAALRDEIATATERQLNAATRYRELVLAHEPALPADLVAGDSIDAIEESVARARQTVAQVRQHLEQQAQALRVPTGSPARVEPDTSDLSAGEKIRLGLRQA